MSQGAIFNAQLLTRLISALALLPVVLGALWWGGVAFGALLVLAFFLMAIEWVQMVRVSPTKMQLGLWLVIGLIYISVPLFCFYWLRQYNEGGWILLWVFLMVWAMDVGGFFAGKGIGGPKMAPKISPNKTWSGLFGGVLLAIVAHYLMFLCLAQFEATQNIAFHPTWVMAGGMAIMAQVGDLIESGFKRHFHIKDTSGIIPGHGGLLDRVDGLLLVAPLVALLIILGQI